MLLAVDAGNTQTVFGICGDGELVEHWRVGHRGPRTSDELGALISRLVDLETVGRRSASRPPSRPSSVSTRGFAERWGEGADPGRRAGGADGDPDQARRRTREIGPDRLMNAVAAKERYGAPCIVVDFGTSTNFDVVSPEGEYVGGVLAPGIEVSMDALFQRAAARLVKVDFVEPSGGDRQDDGDGPAAVRRSSTGFAGQVDGIVAAIRDGLRRRGSGGGHGRAGRADRAALEDDRASSTRCSRWRVSASSGSGITD